MKPASRSLFIFGIYTLINGLGLLLIPNIILPLLTLPVADEVWIRVAGWLICLLGFYYLMGGISNIRPFIRLTVPGRVSVFLFLW